MKNLAFTGFIFSIFSVWEASSHGKFWKIWMILLIPLYFYLWRGVKFFYYNNDITN